MIKKFQGKSEGLRVPRGELELAKISRNSFTSKSVLVNDYKFFFWNEEEHSENKLNKNSSKIAMNLSKGGASSQSGKFSSAYLSRAAVQPTP